MGGCTLGLALWDMAGPGTNATASSASAVKTHRGEERALTERPWFNLATTTGIAILVDISAYPPTALNWSARALVAISTGIKLAPSCDALLPSWTWALGAIPRFASTVFSPYHPNAHPVERYFRRRFEMATCPSRRGSHRHSLSRRNTAVHNGKRQTSPPAMSASGSCCRGAGPRFSMVLYQVMRAAVAVIKAMPIALIRICIPMPPDISTRMK